MQYSFKSCGQLSLYSTNNVRRRGSVSFQPRQLVDAITRKLGFACLPLNEAIIPHFRSNHYLRHNARRLEHLASLRIPVAGLTVLEVGAGIGDHTHYYIDRGCSVTITEVRHDSLRHLRGRYPDQDVEHLDLDNPSALASSSFDIVHCYGLLYHLRTPRRALEYLSGCCRKHLFLETCVSFGDTKSINLVNEQKHSPTQACSGKGCRPTRSWIFDALGDLFPYVYTPITQPHHEEFPIDWTAPEKHASAISRAVFIGSKDKMENALMVPRLLDHQTRQQ
jgi:hypothetical protein